MAIPLCWTDLARKGISSVKERQELLEKAQGLFQLQGKVLSVDREYIGEKWLRAIALIPLSRQGQEMEDGFLKGAEQTTVTSSTPFSDRNKYYQGD